MSGGPLSYASGDDLNPQNVSAAHCASRVHGCTLRKTHRIQSPKMSEMSDKLITRNAKDLSTEFQE